MIPARYRLAPFDLPNGSEREYAALHRFTSRLRQETLPDDPLTPLEVAVRAWRTPTSLLTTDVWLVRRDDGAEVVGRGVLTCGQVAENAHVARIAIQVLPETRRRGLGRALLAQCAAAARASGRRLLIAETSGRVPAGEAFMERLGASRGMEAQTHQLAIADLDRRVLERMQAAATSRASEFELGFWDGPYPEEALEEAAALHQVMNTAPRGSLDLEDQRVRPEQLRAVDAALFARGATRWTLYAREKATGRLAGFTDVVWMPSAPAVLQQIHTGVFPEYRHRGLARRLKAVMLERMLRDRPEVRFVRTANADSNTAMRRINDELGFEPYASQIVWQVGLDGVEAYLGRSSPAGPRA